MSKHSNRKLLVVFLHPNFSFMIYGPNFFWPKNRKLEFTELIITFFFNYPLLLYITVGQFDHAGDFVLCKCFFFPYFLWIFYVPIFVLIYYFNWISSCMPFLVDCCYSEFHLYYMRHILWISTFTLLFRFWFVISRDVYHFTISCFSSAVRYLL